MAKTKTVFFCKNCGTEHSKWMGKCSGCGEWNTLIEEVKAKQTKAQSGYQPANRERNRPQKVREVKRDQSQRVDLLNDEVNRVLGGGLVKGSLVLVGGEPGIGKSTLMLQIALRLQNTKILYVSGEEGAEQIKMRAERIGIHNEECYILNETNTQNIFTEIENIQPDILVLDSIQTLQTELVEASAGSITQIRECAAEFQKFAKTSGTSVLLIGHITKEGTIAGPKLLEHMVDTVLQFEGDRNHEYRILRAHKNRFGSTAEIGIFEMQNGGLREVSNPSEILLSQRDEQSSGTAIAATIEGIRPMLVEVQALTSSAVYGTPQRSTTGFDIRRLNMLLAVLEKRSGFKLATKDVFLNITGGLKVMDPSIDLAVVAAVLSSTYDLAIDQELCFAAEIGLSGEIRPVGRVEQRVQEAEKLGFKKIIVSRYSLKNLDTKKLNIEVKGFAKIEEVFRFVFG
jgi:DNA repair protein RadA/Sms